MNSEIEGTSKMIYLTGVKDGMGGRGGGGILFLTQNTVCVRVQCIVKCSNIEKYLRGKSKCRLRAHWVVYSLHSTYSTLLDNLSDQFLLFFLHRLSLHK